MAIDFVLNGVIIKIRNMDFLSLTIISKSNNQSDCHQSKLAVKRVTLMLEIRNSRQTIYP